MKRRRREPAVNRMSRKLSDDDRRAVDLLLDHGTTNGNGMTRVAAHVSQKRLAAAEKMLKLIGQMPAEEPPANLVEKTLRRIDRATIGRAGHLPRRSHIAPTPPVA